MHRCLHNWFSLHKHWAQPTLPLPPRITTLETSLFSVSALPGRSCLWAAQTLLGGTGCKSGHGLWQDQFTPAGIFLATSQLTSHHQRAGDQYMTGKGLRSTLRMAAEGGCPSQGSSSSLTPLPTPRLAEPSRGELYDLPCNSVLLSGISRTLPEVSTAGKCMCFLVCMHEWDASPLGWVKGTHSDQLYCTRAHIAHDVMMEEWKQITSKCFQRSQPATRTRCLGTRALQHGSTPAVSGGLYFSLWFFQQHFLPTHLSDYLRFLSRAHLHLWCSRERTEDFGVCIGRALSRLQDASWLVVALQKQVAMLL